MHVHNSISLVYAKFDGLSCIVPGYRFWEGSIALQCFVHISDKKNSCNTKVVFNHFGRDSYIYIYMCVHIYGTGLQPHPPVMVMNDRPSCGNWGVSPLPPVGMGRASCMYGWMDGWMDVCMHACMHACMCVCMHLGM